MGKVDLDSMYSDVNSKIGNHIFTTWKGKKVVRRCSTKKRGSTEAQVRVRKTFSSVVSMWRELPPVMQNSWKAGVAGKALTESNLFAKENIPRRRTGVPVLLTYRSGLKKIKGYDVKSETAQTVTVNFPQQPVPVYLSVVLERVERELDEDILDFRYDLDLNTMPVSIAGLESGKEYYVYCVTSEKPFKEAAEVSESTGFKVTVL